MHTLPFNLLLGVSVILILTISYSSKKLPWHVIGSILFLGITLALLLLDMSVNRFHLMKLLCYVIFLHGTVLLLGFGFILKKTFPISAKLSLITATLLALVSLDAFIIEPHWLEISRYKIQSDKMSKPIHIAVLSDFQTDEIGHYEKGVLQQIMDEKPDLILLPGDYIQINNTKKRKEVIQDFRDYLKKINFSAPMGVYAVKGNVETLLSNWPSIFQGLPIRTITAQESIHLKDLELTGLGLWESFNTKKRVKRPHKNKFHLVFGHGPDFALGNIDADLLVAGHTHGGQVRIPFFGPPITLSQVPRAWASGHTLLGKNKHLIVSRGIGLEGEPAPPLRFLCRPELVFIQLEPVNK